MNTDENVYWYLMSCKYRVVCIQFLWWQSICTSIYIQMKVVWIQQASKIPANLILCDNNNCDKSYDVLWIKFGYAGFDLSYDTV